MKRIVEIPTADGKKMVKLSCDDEIGEIEIEMPVGFRKPSRTVKFADLSTALRALFEESS